MVRMGKTTTTTTMMMPSPLPQVVEQDVAEAELKKRRLVQLLLLLPLLLPGRVGDDQVQEELGAG